MSKIYNFFKTNYKSFLFISIIMLILITTQFILPIYISGRVLNIYYSEILMILLIIISFIDILTHKKKLNFDWKILTIAILFILWFFGLTIYRFLKFNDITGGFIIFRVLLFPLLMFFLFKQYNVEKKYIVVSLVLFMCLVNIYQIYDLVYINNSFRSLGALKNINIYLCFSISLIPIMLTFFKNLDNKNNSFIYVCFFKSIIFFNILLIILFSLLAGSRIGLIMCPLVSITSYFFINKFNKKSIFSFLIFALTIFALIFLITNYDIFDSTKNINRATDSIDSIVHKDNKENDDKGLNDENNLQNSNEKTDSNLDNTIVDSNNMRTIIWDKAVKLLSESPIVGKVSNDIEFEFSYSGTSETIKMVQSPHNFILEMSLAFGIPGAILYLLIIVFLGIKILISKISIAYKFNYILSMFAIFGFSFFQPLVTSYFIVSLALWGIMYIYLEEE